MRVTRHNNRENLAFLRHLLGIGNCEEERDEEPDTQIYCPLLGRMEMLNERRESLKDEL